MAWTENEDFISDVDSEDFSEESNFIAFFQETLSDKKLAIGPGKFPDLYTVDENEQLKAIGWLVYMESQDQANSERLESSKANMVTPTDTAEHHNDISLFKESVKSEDLEEAVLSQKNSEGEPAQVPNVREVENYLDFEISGRTFDNHFCKLYNHHMARSCFMWDYFTSHRDFSLLWLKGEIYFLQILFSTILWHFLNFLARSWSRILRNTSFSCLLTFV